MSELVKRLSHDHSDNITHRREDSALETTPAFISFLITTLFLSSKFLFLNFNIYISATDLGGPAPNFDVLGLLLLLPSFFLRLLHAKTTLRTHLALHFPDFCRQSFNALYRRCTMLPAHTLRPPDASAGDHRRHTTTAPHPDEALKCPRCESMNTKFCYYNNYSLSQPRYFCKNCRRYWTKGGTLRNVPVGGGCRKNKRLKPKTLDAAVLDPSSSSMLGNVRNNISSPLPPVFSSSCSSGYAGTGLSFCRESKRLPGECISTMNVLPSLDTSFMGINNYGSSSSVKRQEGLLYGVPDISFMENISSEKLADERRACIQYQDSAIYNMPMESLNNLSCIEAPSKEHKLFQEESWRHTKGRDGQPEPYMDRQGDPNAWTSINGTGWPYFHSLLNSAVGAAFSC